MIAHGKNIKIFAGNSHPELAEEIANLLGLTLGNSKVSTFSDGEISVDINETVRGADVFIVQSTSSPVNNNLMELLIMIDAFKRAFFPYLSLISLPRVLTSKPSSCAKFIISSSNPSNHNTLLNNQKCILPKNKLIFSSPFYNFLIFYDISIASYD